MRAPKKSVLLRVFSLRDKSVVQRDVFGDGGAIDQDSFDPTVRSQLECFVDEICITSKDSVFETPWFRVVGKSVGHEVALHYSITTLDYVHVLAVTKNGTFPLVRQFRPALEMVTLELPSGHVDSGETPEQAAKRELREETGFVANELILLGSLSPDTGRMSNRLWCFFAPQVGPNPPADFKPQPDVEPVVYDKPLRNLILAEPAFSSALNRATILMAAASGHIEL